MSDLNINSVTLPGTSSDQIFSTMIKRSKEIIESMNNRIRLTTKILKESDG